jgi:RNA polymerase sigma-70 factor (ECF subfamily)
MQNEIKESKTGVSVAGLIEDYGRMVSSICRRMIQDEDSAQEVWLEVMKSLPSFQGAAKVSTWIYTIAARVAKRHAHHDRVYSTRFLSDYFREGERELPDSRDFDQNLWVRQMCDRCLTGILHCLEPDARIAYILRDMAGLPYDIAAILERTRSRFARSFPVPPQVKHFLEASAPCKTPRRVLGGE